MVGVAHVVVFLSGHLGSYVDAHIVDKHAALIPRVTELGSGRQRSDKVEEVRSSDIGILHSVQTWETYHWNNFHILFSCPTLLKICNVWFSEVH